MGQKNPWYIISLLLPSMINLSVGSAKGKGKLNYKLDKVLSWVLMLISIVIIIQSFSLCYISISYQQNPALTIDIVPDAFQVLLLSPLPEIATETVLINLKQKTPICLTEHFRV